MAEQGNGCRTWPSKITGAEHYHRVRLLALNTIAEQCYWYRILAEHCYWHRTLWPTEDTCVVHYYRARLLAPSTIVKLDYWCRTLLPSKLAGAEIYCRSVLLGTKTTIKVTGAYAIAEQGHRCQPLLPSNATGAEHFCRARFGVERYCT